MFEYKQITAVLIPACPPNLVSNKSVFCELLSCTVPLNAYKTCLNAGFFSSNKCYLRVCKAIGHRSIETVINWL